MRIEPAGCDESDTRFPAMLGVMVVSRPVAGQVNWYFAATEKRSSGVSTPYRSCIPAQVGQIKCGRSIAMIESLAPGRRLG